MSFCTGVLVSTVQILAAPASAPRGNQGIRSLTEAPPLGGSFPLWRQGGNLLQQGRVHLYETEACDTTQQFDQIRV